MRELRARALDVELAGRLVLCSIDLTLVPGELVVVIGPNGAGKTTLVRALAGTVAPSRGCIELDGAPLAALDRRAIARRIAVVPQELGVVDGYDVREVVAMGRAPHQGAWLRPSLEDERAVDAALDRCGLAELADRAFAELSGGERKRVVVAQALAQRAEIVLLDEPSAHLDAKHAIEVMETVAAEVRRGVAALAVVHDLVLCTRFADRVVVLQEGRVVVDDRPELALTSERLSPVFGLELVPLRAPSGEITTFAPARAPNSVLRLPHR